MLADVIINKVSGGLGRVAPATDMISGLIANGVGLPGAQLGTVYRLNRIEDAQAMGLDADYDEANSVLVYEHIKEFFRINRNGQLWLLLVAQSVSFPNLVDPTVATSAKKLLIEANGAINQLAVAFNPETAPTDDTALLAAIAKAQLLVADEFANHRPLHVILEGKGIDLADITDLRALNAPGVSVMVGQSKTVAAIDPLFADYGAVGTLLGAVSLAAVNENVAWVQKFNVLGDNLQDFAIASTASSSLTVTQLENLNDAGYIFFRKHTGLAGIYFNDSHTCDELTSDYCYIETNRVANKAARIARTTLLPYLNSPVNINPTTGQIAVSTIKSMEALAQRAIEDGMLKPGELSSFSFTIDPSQNILSTSELECELTLVPTGTARKIVVKLGFTNPFNS